MVVNEEWQLLAFQTYLDGRRVVIFNLVSSNIRWFWLRQFVLLNIFKKYIFSWPRHTTCGTLVLQPGIEPTLPALKVWRLNHWTVREVPQHFIRESVCLCAHNCLVKFFVYIFSWIYYLLKSLHIITPISGLLISLVFLLVFHSLFLSSNKPDNFY